MSALRAQIGAGLGRSTLLGAARGLLSPSAFGVGRQRPGRALSLEANSLGLIAAKVTTMGVGFLFWIVAARLFTRSDVGLAAGVVAALMLCTQIGILGIGSSVIAEFRRHERSPQMLVNSAVTLVVATSAGAAAIFVLLGLGVFGDLSVVASSPLYALVFLVAAVSATMLTLFDQVAAAQRRGDHAFARAILFGGGTLLALSLVATASAEGSLAIFAPWAISALAAVALAVRQLRRTIDGYRPKPVRDRALLGGLLRLGVPNHILTLSERVPGLLLPILVAELVSARANAAWYAAWMMAWLAYMVPVQTGIATFAEVARDPSRLDDVVSRALRNSLTLGGAAAAALLVLAEPLLSLLGSSYAADGATPLRVLAVGVLPISFTFVYFAACRGLRSPQRAIPLGWAGVVLVVAATVPALELGGLTAMALAFVAAQSVVGVIAAWRLRRLRSCALTSSP